jgi:hypothetical protein
MPILRSGITSYAINDNVIKGAFIAHPRDLTINSTPAIPSTLAIS